MDEQNVATNVEVDNSQVTATPAVDNTVTNVEVDNSQVTDNSQTVDNSQVINTATPMDSNTTYNNLTPEQVDTNIDNTEVAPTTYDTNKDPLQNAIQTAITNDREDNLNANAGNAMNKFLNEEYDYDKNEAGTYWVAGAINDVNTQMSFLNTLINEEMYDVMDLQKFYYDNSMATARAYAAQKNMETAYGFYRAAQEKAIAEASLTGWYMPAEGEYLLHQYTIAQSRLTDPNATPAEIAKANNVSKVTEQWFNANNIGPRGMKCLSRMSYEETVRHNEIMGQLLHEANQIAGASAAASAAAADLELREFKFQIEEAELQYGINLTKQIGLSDDDYLGHDIRDPEYAKYQALRGGSNVSEIAKNADTYNTLLGMRGVQWLKDSLGADYDEYRLRALGNTGNNVLDSLDQEGTNIINLDNLRQIGKLKDVEIDGRKMSGEVYEFTMNNSSGGTDEYVFVKTSEGGMLQLDKKYLDKELTNGKKINDIVKNYTEGEINYNGKTFKVANQVTLEDFKKGPIYNTKGLAVDQDHLDSVQECLDKGWELQYGYYYETKGMGILSGENSKGIVFKDQEGNYWTVSNEQGNIEAADKGRVVKIPDKNYDELSDAQKKAAQLQSTFVSQDKDGDVTRSYETNGHVHYIKGNNPAGSANDFWEKAEWGTKEFLENSPVNFVTLPWDIAEGKAEFSFDYALRRTPVIGTIMDMVDGEPKHDKDYNNSWKEITPPKGASSKSNNWKTGDGTYVDTNTKTKKDTNTETKKSSKSSGGASGGTSSSKTNESNPEASEVKEFERQDVEDVKADETKMLDKPELTLGKNYPYILDDKNDFKKNKIRT